MNFTKKELQNVSDKHLNKWIKWTFARWKLNLKIRYSVMRGRRLVTLYFFTDNSQTIESNHILIKSYLQQMFPDLDIRVYGNNGIVEISWE